MESEKKTRRPVKKVYSGPMIQYKSTRMPIIEEMETSERYVFQIIHSLQIFYLQFSEHSEFNKFFYQFFIYSDIKKENIEPSKEFCERTFITILNDPNNIIYKKLFNVKPPPVLPKKLKCAVTG